MFKAIKIVIADEKQINVVFNPELSSIHTVHCYISYSEFKLATKGAGNVLHQHRSTNTCQKKALFSSRRIIGAEDYQKGRVEGYGYSRA